MAPAKSITTPILTRLAALPLQPPLMIEHLQTEQEYHQSRDYLLATGQRIGVDFR